MRNPLCAFLLSACIVLASLPVSAQEPDPIATWLALVNKARLDEGLPPYSVFTLLTASAQRHADDLAAHGFTSEDAHVGSDGSTTRQRIAETGYAAWTWNDGELIAGENIWSGEIEEGMAYFLQDPPHRENILSATYREIGLGFAADAEGRNYYVLDFGARPNVLPIFVNEDAASTDNPEIAIRLTNEEARPEGAGTSFMGQAIEVRINDEPNWDDLEWQPWERYVSWTLPDTPGEHTIYVQFRDAAGRTAASADTIVLGEGTPPAPTPSTPSPTSEPTATTAPTAAAGATPEPTTAPAPAVTSIPEPSPTAAPSPTVPSPSSLAPNITPFPTWTPLPTPSPPKTGEHGIPLGAVAVLQGVALVFGIYLALRRGGRVRRIGNPPYST